VVLRILLTESFIPFPMLSASSLFNPELVMFADVAAVFIAAGFVDDIPFDSAGISWGLKLTQSAAPSSPSSQRAPEHEGCHRTRVGGNRSS